MKDNHKLYSRWLDHRRQIAAPETFSNDVMKAVKRAPAPREQIGHSGLQAYLNHPWSRRVAASGLVALGLFRILYIAGSIFRTSLVMP